MDNDINTIIDSVNEILYKFEPDGAAQSCHGRLHTMFVVEKTEYILKSLNQDSRMVELGKTAALLHDIGNIAGRKKHAKKSAALATVFLEETDFTAEEKSIIIQAIEGHSGSGEITSTVAAALLIADKIDVTKNRLLPYDTFDYIGEKMQEIEDVILGINDKVITINFIVTENFQMDFFTKDYKKGLDIQKKAAKYLGCECVFQFNGEEQTL